MIKREFQFIDNYIYLYHVDEFIVIPSYADSVTDTLSVNFASSFPLSRSAPIYSYQSSGPRQIQVQFDLHRDMMQQLNYSKSNARVTLTDDYVDLMIKYIQAAALPDYAAAEKMVNPPLVAMRLGDDIFIKGVISGAVSVTYKYPILSNGKYSNITIAFTIHEVDPYDAKTVMKNGSFRGLSTSLERKIWGTKSTTSYDIPSSSQSSIEQAITSSGGVSPGSMNTRPSSAFTTKAMR